MPTLALWIIRVEKDYILIKNIEKEKDKGF